MSPSSSAAAPKKSWRGVYVSEFTVNGHRWVYSVNSRDEQVTLRTVADIPDEIEATSSELWAELDRLDPVKPGASFRPAGFYLRLL